VHGDHFARAQKLRPCSGYENVPVPALYVEFYVVELAQVLPVLHLCIGQGRHASGAPVDREVALVDQPHPEQLHEGDLGYPPVIGGVGLIVYAGVHALSEYLEVVLHLLYEAVGEIGTELPVFAAGEVQFGYAVLLLHSYLDGRTVDVKAKGEEHIASPHSPVAGSEIDKGIAGCMTQMKGARCVSGGIVYAVYGLLGLGIESVYGLFFPHPLPAFLYRCGIVLGHWGLL